MPEIRELSSSRHIEAAPAKVWDTMVNRQEERMVVPRPWHGEIDAQERRPGG